MEPLAEEDTARTQQLDLTDPAYAALAGYARRIGTLLDLPMVQADPSLAGSLDDFLGSVYALILAKQGDFEDRTTRSIEIVAVQKRAGQIAAGELRTDGKWMAGFHFNSALFRTAAVYHRILKIILGKDGNVPALQTEAIQLYGRWISIRLHKVYSQVNELKHEPQGSYSGRLATYREALDAIGDLLDLIEAWRTASTPPRITP